MIITLDLVLTGARAGKTVVLNGKQFVQGVLRLRGSHEQLEPVTSYYGRAYHAFPAGSQALAEAQARDKEEAAKVAHDDGEHHTDEVAQPGSAVRVPGSGADADAGRHQAASSAAHDGSDHGAQAGGQGAGANGDGHADSGLRTGQGSKQQQSDAHGDLNALRVAVMGLDPDVAENWTADGKPTVEAVATVLNDPSVSRKRIDAAAADWSREQAAAQKKLAK